MSPVIFSSANGNAISVVDPSLSNSLVQLMLSTTGGMANLGTASGLTFTSGANGSASMTVQGTLAAIDAALSGMDFMPGAQYIGAAALDLTFSDLGVGSVEPAQTISQTVAITVNGPPVATVPASQTTPANTPLVFSASNGNLISLLDSYLGAKAGQLTLLATNGTLTLSNTSGLTFKSGTNGSAALMVQGTLSALNTALAGLKFTPTTNYAGGASVSLTFSDLGIGGVEAAQTVSQTVSITVKYPDYTINAEQTGYTETGTWSTSSTAGYNGVAMRTNSASGTATWTPTLGAGTYQVSIYNPAVAGASTDVKITLVNNGNTRTFTLNEATGTAGFFNLGSFYFKGTGGEYLSISQGTTAGVLYASAAQFVGEGSPPTITAPTTQSMVHKTALVFSSANSNAISITDASLTSNVARLALTATNGTLTLSTTSGLTFTSGTNDSATLTVQGTLSSINAAIAGLKFTPTTNYAGAASIGLTFSDLGVGGAGPMQTVSQSVSVSVN